MRLWTRPQHNHQFTTRPAAFAVCFLTMVAPESEEHRPAILALRSPGGAICGAVLYSRRRKCDFAVDFLHADAGDARIRDWASDRVPHVRAYPSRFGSCRDRARADQQDGRWN